MSQRFESGFDGDEAIRVVLLILSGRPDPQWELDEWAVRDLVERLRVVVDRPPLKEPAPSGGLGYRGFRLHIRRPIHDLPEIVTVFRGVIAAPSQAVVWSDSEAIEERLLADARARGYGPLLEASRAGGSSEPPPTAAAGA